MAKQKTFDGVEVLAKITGQPKEEVQKIWKGVKDNHARLDACAGPHDFQREEQSGGQPIWRCSICKGTVNGSAVHWYKQGLKHSRSAG